MVRELDGLILTGGGDLSSCLFGKPPHPQTGTSDAWRDVWEYRAVGLAALHPHPGHLPGDAAHERGAGWNALPGPASRVAEGAATTAAPSRERQGLLLELGQPPHPVCAARQPIVCGGAREGSLDRPFLDAVLSMHHQAVEELGARPGSCRHVS